MVLAVANLGNRQAFGEDAMNMPVTRSTIVLAALLCASAASAQSLKLKEAFAHDREKVAELSKDANAACGSNISFSVDYSTYSGLLDDDNNQNPWAYLANATDALKRVCATPDGKQAVQSKIKSVVAANGPDESESLTNGVFRYTVPYSGHSPQTVIAWLEAHL